MPKAHIWRNNVASKGRSRVSSFLSCGDGRTNQAACQTFHILAKLLIVGTIIDTHRNLPLNTFRYVH
jgi:hypothetical protein